MYVGPNFRSYISVHLFVLWWSHRLTDFFQCITQEICAAGVRCPPKWREIRDNLSSKTKILSRYNVSTYKCINLKIFIFVACLVELVYSKWKQWIFKYLETPHFVTIIISFIPIKLNLQLFCNLFSLIKLQRCTKTLKIKIDDDKIWWK